MVATPGTASQEPRSTTGEFPTGGVPVYITKSNFFRVIHVDGFFGGGSPTPGNIVMTVYNQRVALPDKAFLDAMGVEIPSKREAKIGLEHEYEASFVMSIATARIMLLWLGNTINNIEQQLQQRNQNK
jgi:hypothetical protein